MYLISLYFDEKSEKKLQFLTDRIAAGTGNRFLTENHVPPHLTVAAFETDELNDVIPAFEHIAKMTKSGELYFATVGALFPYVLYSAPVYTDYLDRLVSLCEEGLKGQKRVKFGRFYQKNQWLPHVTLGKRLTTEQMQRGFALMQKHFTPFTASAVKIGLAKTNPHTDLLVCELKKED